jgi:hypothetical protein
VCERAARSRRPSRERLEDADLYLSERPRLGLAVQRHGEELRLVNAPEVTRSVERHLNLNGWSRSAARRSRCWPSSPTANRSLARVSSSSAARPATAPSLPERGLIAHNPHHLFVTKGASLNYVGLRDLADLPANYDSE